LYSTVKSEDTEALVALG